MLELDVEDLDHQGRGIGRHEGVVVLVEGALPDERVRVRVEHRGRRHWVASLLEVLTPSPHRRRPPCILADHCGGCSLQHLSQEGQDAWTMRRLEETLRRLGGLEVSIRPLLAAASEFGYRNRAVIPLQRQASGALKAGYYRRGSHRIVNMNRCPVLDPRIDRLIAPLKADLEATGWSADPHHGILRHLSLRVGHGSGQVLITLVASQDELPGLRELAADWLERWPEVVGVSLNLQPNPTNVLFGERTLVLAGQDHLMESFGGLELEIGPDTFFQVNTAQAERVLPLLIEALPPEPGVQANAHRLNLADRAHFAVGDVGALLDDHLTAAGPQARLLLDPPRRGLDRVVVEVIRERTPRQVLYLSCDPATLSRDLALLSEGNLYRVEWAQPLDFFPATTHGETFVVLSSAALP
jgi:23S rRNA (uracil1939-C5)-methyltransferase